ncbi:hypothetical protein [Streptomyces sp. AC495_CC817]|uniref:hypothetical protein n=1 Tax=Streptomyces sp. AC495_CC817 TaxID=2823900 RepID=UPI001C27C708|nr:hypothetical protein [Streptomyces sp. AC495_CC817]
MTRNRVRLSGGADWQADFRRRTTGRAPRSAMEIATVRRTLNHTLTELKRAIDRRWVAVAADLYALAWQQVAGAPPSETRQQRALLQAYKEILASRRWQEAERLQASSAPPAVTSRPGQSAAAPPRPPSAGRAEKKKPLPPSQQQNRTEKTVAPPVRPTGRPAAAAAAAAAAERPPLQAQPALLATARLYEIATGLRPLLEETAKAGATTSWPLIRKHLPGLGRLHPDDESVILWLVDEDRQEGQPLLAALVTTGNRQMHPRFPVIAEQLGLPCGTNTAQQQTTWSYEVLKVHQHWHHRRR